MPLPRPLPPPRGHDPEVWSRCLRTSPGSAVAAWLEEHEGLSPEVHGPNRGPWFETWVPFASANDGSAWCASLVAALLEAAGARRIRGPKRHWYWHNRAAKVFEDGHKEQGQWAGPRCMPQRGWLQFSKRTGGHHVDVVTRFEPLTGEVYVIGGNVGDKIQRRQFRFGSEAITGYGVPVAEVL